MTSDKDGQWRPFADYCLHCGGDAEAFTTSGNDNWAYDGDTARCTDCGCPGIVSIQEAGEDHCDNGIDWHDEPGCDCDWCVAHPA